MSACGELAKAKEELNGLKATIQQKTKRALEISYGQLVNLRRSLSELGGKTSKRPEDPGFSENYAEYKSKNPKFGTFSFSSPKMKTALELLDKAYQSADPRVSVTDLVTQIYASELVDVAIDSKGRRRERTRDEVLSNKGSWRLERDIFGIDDEVVKYQMIQVSPTKKNGEKAYILDFSFEDKDPETFLREIQDKKDKKASEKVQKKTKTVADKQSAKKAHPWSKQGRSRKAEVYTNKGGTFYEGEDDNSDE